MYGCCMSTGMWRQVYAGDAWLTSLNYLVSAKSMREPASKQGQVIIIVIAKMASIWETRVYTQAPTLGSIHMHDHTDECESAHIYVPALPWVLVRFPVMLPILT